jgi:uncharacterized protein (DUF2235 family)
MGRNIVLCFDGTNNEYAAINTNVVKLYAMLDRKGDQLAYYQPGIGTFAPPGVWGKTKKWIITRLDLAIAWLLEDHVCDGYRYLMRYYQEGDQIFIFGFSRGAYTARALAGMLHKVGLLSQGNEELIDFAWATYRKPKNWTVSDGFKKTFCRDIPIHFMGLWDTVSSIGWAWHPSSLEFTANNPSVRTVRHAIALDERRSYFVQNLWGHAPAASTDILQVWFPGVHCDVGGGYVEAEAGLSKIALKWMVDQAKKFFLLLDPIMEVDVLPQQDTPEYAAPNPLACQHESLKGLWWIVELLPKQYRDPAQNFKNRWIIHRGQHRYVADGSNIHTSIIERINKLSSYRPPNIPATFQEVR